MLGDLRISRAPPMLRTLGFVNVPAEVAAWFVFFVALGSLLAAWVVDNIMDDLGFGVIGNAVLLFLGALGGLWAWNLYEGTVRATDPVTLTLICVGSGFFAVFAMAILRRMAHG
ncbi:hypothetical protein SLNSH_11620 [Alsobacter soli]|uniref:GlsB/YeaQ/YmgE family stress response membrane protein n=2 Tax=Alsobacter soli TaxID=2109933 RepID=A0A2T1HSX0_9HYPH|nr:hypothetical protein SLNSH_11620 [Alsobacter soli]